MKLALSFTILYVIVSSNGLSARELVRGGNLGITQDYLVHIEEHHGNLEMIEDNLETLTENKEPIFRAENILQKGADYRDIKNEWAHNDPSWEYNAFGKRLQD